MSVECCGKERDSRFCPECGKKLADGPLLDLLAHLRKNEKIRRNDARLYEKWADDERARHGDEGREYHGEESARAFARRCAQDEALAEKWRSWADALAGLMAGKPPESPGAAPFAAERATYEARKAGLLMSEGQFVAIWGEELLGPLETYDAALEAGYESFGEASFMVKKIEAVETVHHL